jgi:hypothetical protein
MAEKQSCCQHYGRKPADTKISVKQWVPPEVIFLANRLALDSRSNLTL